MAKANKVNAGTGKLKGGNSERYTAVFETAILEDLKNIAYWNRSKIKDVFGKAFIAFIEAWKKDPTNKSYVTAGKIKSRPDNADE